jgi:hypothetical protein
MIFDAPLTKGTFIERLAVVSAELKKNANETV